jgi:hypothetical protein
MSEGIACIREWKTGTRVEVDKPVREERYVWQ